MKILLGLLVVLLLMESQAAAATLPAGTYRTSAGHTVYVGPENELPDPATDEYYDPITRQFGDVPSSTMLKPVQRVHEDRRVIQTQNGSLGVSLYYSDTAKRAAVILIHGNDPETREMGYLIPYFVLSGIDVISYDQRGTGASAGNWQASGPAQRALDVEAVYDAYAPDARIDSRRIGVFGFSNGGWTAPIVAVERPVAFMLLKSAPAETIADNLCYEASQNMRHHGFGYAVPQALGTWRAILAALAGTGSWDTAKAAYAAVNGAPWLSASRIPSKLTFPPPPALAAGFERELSYDPAATLHKVTTPTLALFGTLDRNVDTAHAAKTMRADFKDAGMSDFTIRFFPNAGHQLIVTPTGFWSDAPKPLRLATGYPGVMIDWLKQRNFLR